MRTSILLFCGLCMGTTAHAADNGFYLGVGVGQSNVEIDLGGGNDFDGDDVGFKAIAGIRPLDWLGFEANYVNFGTADDDKYSFESEGYAFSGFVVGFLPLGPVDAFAKVGGFQWNQELKAPGLTSEDVDGTDLAYGVGVQFRLLSLGIRAEYELFDVKDDFYKDTTLVSLGVTYTFL